MYSRTERELSVVLLLPPGNMGMADRVKLR